MQAFYIESTLRITCPVEMCNHSILSLHYVLPVLLKCAISRFCRLFTLFCFCFCFGQWLIFNAIYNFHHFNYCSSYWSQLKKQNKKTTTLFSAWEWLDTSRWCSSAQIPFYDPDTRAKITIHYIFIRPLFYKNVQTPVYIVCRSEVNLPMELLDGAWS